MTPKENTEIKRIVNSQGFVNTFKAEIDKINFILDISNPDDMCEPNLSDNINLEKNKIAKLKANIQELVFNILEFEEKDEIKTKNIKTKTLEIYKNLPKNMFNKYLRENVIQPKLNEIKKIKLRKNKKGEEYFLVEFQDGKKAILFQKNLKGIKFVQLKSLFKKSNIQLLGKIVTNITYENNDEKGSNGLLHMTCNINTKLYPKIFKHLDLFLKS